MSYGAKQPFENNFTRIPAVVPSTPVHTVFDEFFSARNGNDDVADIFAAFGKYLTAKHPEARFRVDSASMDEDWAFIAAAKAIGLVAHERQSGGRNTSEKSVETFLTRVDSWNSTQSTDEIVTAMLDVLPGSNLSVPGKLLKRITRFAVGAFASAKTPLDVITRGLLGANAMRNRVTRFELYKPNSALPDLVKAEEKYDQARKVLAEKRAQLHKAYTSKKYSKEENDKFKKAFDDASAQLDEASSPSISVSELVKVLNFSEPGVSLLMSQLFDPTHMHHRLCTACFLYFITTAEIPEDQHHYLNFMYPVFDPAFKDKQKLKVMTREMLTLCSNGNIYMTVDEGHFYNVFPPMQLLWHELVRGMFLGAVSCCVDVSFAYSDIDAEISRIRSEQVPLNCWNRRTWLRTWKETKSDAWRHRRAVKQLQSTTEHVVYYCTHHGALPKGKKTLTQVPDNVTLLKVGIAGELSVTKQFATKTTTGADMHCKIVARNVLMKYVDLDTRGGGFELVASGAYYPELRLASADDTAYRSLFKCGLNPIDMDPTQKKVNSLSGVLKMVSEDARKHGHMAFLIVVACQSTDDVHVQTNGLASTFSSLRPDNDNRTMRVRRGKDIENIDSVELVEQSYDRRKLPRRRPPKLPRLQEVSIPVPVHAAVSRSIDNARMPWRGGAVSPRRAWIAGLAVVTLVAAFAH